jgi:hypothetical protein
MLPSVAQKGQRVFHVQQAKERVKGADGEIVPASELDASHVAVDPPDALAFLPAPLDHRLRHLDGGYVVACSGKWNRQSSGPGAPLDNRASFAFGEDEPEREVVIVGVLQVVEVG